MFRQETIQKRNKKQRTAEEERKRQKNKDKNRKRNHTVAFRVTEIEKELIDEKVKLSGRLKQEYLIDAVLNHKVIFRGDRQVFNIMMANLEKIDARLKEIESPAEINEKDMYILKTIIEMMDNLYEKEKSFQQKS